MYLYCVHTENIEPIGKAYNPTHVYGITTDELIKQQKKALTALRDYTETETHTHTYIYYGIGLLLTCEWFSSRGLNLLK